MNNQEVQLSVRNLILGIGNGAIFWLAMAFLDPETVLPAFAMDIGGGNILWVGILVAMIGSGWCWPQVFVASILQTKPRYLPYYRLSALARIITRFAIWAAIMLLGTRMPVVLLAVVAILLFVYASAGGVGLIPFMSIVSDTIPATWRGKFFGARLFLGGLLGFGAGFVVKHVLSPGSGWDFPHNYGQLVLFSAVAVTVSVVLFSFAEERPHPVPAHQLPLRLQLARGPRFFRRDPNFRRLVRARVFYALAYGLCVPFIVPFALQQFGVAKAAVGIFLMARVLSFSGANTLWSYISDRIGNRLVLLISGVAATMLPLMMALGPQILQIELAWLGGSVSSVTVYFLLGFVLVGLSSGGQMLGQINYLLEVAPPRLRTTYLGFYFTVLLPLAWVPVIGSLIIGQAGRYTLGFVLSLIMAVAMLINVVKLGEIRELPNEQAKNTVSNTNALPNHLRP